MMAPKSTETPMLLVPSDHVPAPVLRGPRPLAAALVALLVAALRHGSWQGPLLLFALLSLEGALGGGAPAPGQPAVWSILHQVCAIAVITAALAPSDLWRSDATIRRPADVALTQIAP